MRQGAPTNADPLDSEVLANLQEAARRSGLPFGEWLRTRLLEEAAASAAPASAVVSATAAAGPARPATATPAMGELRRRVADLAGEIDRLAGAEPPPVPHRGSRAPAGESLTTALDSLNARIESLLRDPDKGSPAAATHLDETVRRLNSRLEAMVEARRGTETRPPALRETESASFEKRMGEVARTVEQLGRRLSTPAPAPSHRSAPAADPALDAAVREIAARQRRLDEPAIPAAATEPVAPAAAVAPVAPAPAAPPAAAADLSWLERQLNAISGQMAELTRASGEAEERERPAAKAVEALRGDLAELRGALQRLAPQSAVEELGRSLGLLAGRLEQRDDSAFGTEVTATLAELTASVEALRPAQDSQELAGEIEALSRKLDIVSAKTVDGATIARLQAQTAEIRDLLGRALSGDAVRLLAEQVALLADRMEQLANPDERVAREVAELLGARIDDLAARIEAHADRRTAGAEHVAALEEIGGRLDQLQAAVAGAARAAPQGMQEMFDALMARIETLTRPDAAANEAVEAFASQFSSQFSSEVASRLASDVSSQVSQQVSSEVTARLAAQIAAVAERIDATDSRFTQLAGIERALDDLFVQMEEARAGLIATAEQSARGAAAAEIAAGRSGDDLAEGIAGAMAEGIAMLQRELADLGIRQEDSERRTCTTLESVHETLERVVDRIASLDTLSAPRAAADAAPRPDAGIRADTAAVVPVAVEAPAAAALFRDTAEEDAALAALVEPLLREAASRIPASRSPEPAAEAEAEAPAFPDDFPLEPGSGLPRQHAARLAREVAEAALADDRIGPVAPAVRLDDEPVPGPSRADFIAAARRAAQTAGARPKSEDGTEKEGGFRLSRLLSRARLPLLVGVCGSAVALAAWQYAGTLGVFGPETVTLGVGSVAKESAEAPATPDPGLGVPAGAMPASGVLAAPSAFGLEPAAGGSSAAARTEPAFTGSVPAAAVPVAPDATPAPAAAPTGELPSAIGGPALRAAARAGDPAAAYEVGARYAEGRGVGPNAARAASWFAFAAARGSVPAAYRLGVLLEKGAEGLPRDVARARALYDGAARAGNVRAMHNYGVLLAEGIDGQPNYAEAVVWFRRAAERGVRDSQYNLGVLTTRGLGTRADLADAWKWFSLAAAQGDADAGAKRDEVASRLDPQELVTLRFAVQTWTPVAADEQANVALVNPEWDRAEAPAKRNAKTAKL